MACECAQCGAPLPTQSVMAFCVREGCELFDQPLPIKGRLRALLPERARLALGAWSAPPESVCPACQGRTVVLCEHCGAAQSGALLRYPELRVAVCGRPGAGKSTLTAAMLTALGRARGVMMQQLPGDDSAERLAREYTQPLWERGVFPAPAGGALRFGFSRAVRGLPPRACVLRLSDLPGALFEPPCGEAFSQSARAASGLIVALNPMTLPALHALAGAHGAEPDCEPEHAARALALLDALRDASAPALGAHSDQPLALVLTHMDRWLPFARLPGLARADYDEALSRCDGMLLEALLHRWGADALCARLSGFRCARVFASGVVPGCGARALSGAQSPALWLLSKLGA